VYRQRQAINEAGEVCEIDSGDLHLPDVPASAIPMLNSFLTNGFPPAVLGLLEGKISPLKIMAALKDASNGTG
jgi:hypothetical protein